MGSLILYLVIFLLSVLFYLAYCKYDKKVFLIISFILPFILGSIRYYVGTDYKNYVILYQYNADVNTSFNIIAAISKKLGSYVWMFAIYQFLTLFFFYLGLKNVKREIRPFVYLCYLFMNYVNSYNAVRQALAVCIIFYAYKFLIKEDAKKWILFVLLATFFHTTAIICLPVYILFHNKNGKMKVLSLVLISLLVIYYENILYYFSSFSIFSHYSMYIGERLEIANNKSFYIELLMLVYILLFRKQLIKYDDNNKTYIYLYIVCIILSTVGFINPYVKRISGYFSFSKLVLLAHIPLICKNWKNKMLNYVLIFSFIIILFVVNYYIYGHAEVIPYRTIFNENI